VEGIEKFKRGGFIYHHNTNTVVWWYSKIVFNGVVERLYAFSQKMRISFQCFILLFSFKSTPLFSKLTSKEQNLVVKAIVPILEETTNNLQLDEDFLNLPFDLVNIDIKSPTKKFLLIHFKWGNA
jgi:hypothetical protein